MADVPMKNAPNLGGWVIGAAMGLVAFGAAHVAMGVGLTGAAFVGVVVALAAGWILGMPGRELPALSDAMPAAAMPAAAMPASSAPAAPMAAAPAAAAPAAAAPVPAAPMPAASAPTASVPVPAAAMPVSPAPAAAEPASAAPSAATPAPAAAAPVAAASSPAPAAAGSPRRPEALAAARGGRADDLKIIKGIGPKLEQLCHRLGFYHFDQVAGWTADEIAWVDENLEGFKGRVTRDRWVPQAQAIVTHGPQEFLRRLEAGEAF
jgi:predicted flap endonuclease-1-like 5' DNA nuclease